MGDWEVLYRYRGPIDPDWDGAPTVLTLWRDNLGGRVLGIDVGDGEKVVVLPLPATATRDLAGALAEPLASPAPREATMPDTPIPSDPVALLRRAVEVLRETASGATPGPWMLVHDDGWGRYSVRGATALPVADRLPGTYEPQHIIAEHDDDLEGTQAEERLGSLSWIATMSPAVAEPLEALLVVFKARFERRASTKAGGWDVPDPEADRAALALARSIVEAGGRSG